MRGLVLPKPLIFYSNCKKIQNYFRLYTTVNTEDGFTKIELVVL